MAQDYGFQLEFLSFKMLKIVACSTTTSLLGNNKNRRRIDLQFKGSDRVKGQSSEKQTKIMYQYVGETAPNVRQTASVYTSPDESQSYTDRHGQA